MVNATGRLLGGRDDHPLGTNWAVAVATYRSRCGNGVVNPGEQCDDGNSANGDCCSSTCQLDPAGTACGSATSDTCDDPDTCNASGACLLNHKTDGTLCSDGSACTTNDACLSGACMGGPAPDCNDANGCTDDSCNPATGCVHTPNTAPCDDGNACTTSDACSGGACAGGAALDCDDGNPCTDDTCNPATGCVHTNNTAPCDDGNACTTADRVLGRRVRGRAGPGLRRRERVHATIRATRRRDA